MSEFTEIFLNFIDAWGYFAVAVLMAAENACIPIPSELILGFAGFMVYEERMTVIGATVAGMIGGMIGSVFAYWVGYYGGRPFVDKYGKYFFMSKSHVDLAQRWFDKYGIKAVFFSRMLPVVRTFISLPAGFARVNFKAFLLYTFLGSLPWTVFIIACGMLLGESWRLMLEIGHEASIAFVVASALIIAGLYWQYRKKKKRVR
ncbi:DedA family protein [Selenomonas sp. TAMA-11512]|uniref:DedA family protein n=1 Tax=Selenomonas sp. TAMA-11512 TaxID=3095337 RepID=UPI00308D87DF|nr:DedA family protein [Selenomonas sp. TAMA-11512]